MPPVTATLESPARIAWSARPSDRMPEAQTLLIVSEGTSIGIPPLIWAWREGIWPWPACNTWPKTTCWTCSGATPERSRAASITVPPRSVASREERPPPIFPNGVRAVPRITELGIYCLSFPKFADLAPVRQVQRMTIPTGRRLAADEGRGTSERAAGHPRRPAGRRPLRGGPGAGGNRDRAWHAKGEGDLQEADPAASRRSPMAADSRPRPPGGDRPRAPSRRRRAGRERGRATGGDVDRVDGPGERRRRICRRCPGHRDDPRRLPFRPLQVRGGRRVAAARDADPARPGRARRRRRGRPHCRRSAEPRPRPAADPRQRRHPDLPR